MKTYLIKETGAHIRALREEKKIKIKDMADAIYLDSKQITKIETGRIVPRIEYLVLIADFLDVSINELVVTTSA